MGHLAAHRRPALCNEETEGSESAISLALSRWRSSLRLGIGFGIGIGLGLGIGIGIGLPRGSLDDFDVPLRQGDAFEKIP